MHADGCGAGLHPERQRVAPVPAVGGADGGHPPKNDDPHGHVREVAAAERPIERQSMREAAARPSDATRSMLGTADSAAARTAACRRRSAGRARRARRTGEDAKPVQHAEDRPAQRRARRGRRVGDEQMQPRKTADGISESRKYGTPVTSRRARSIRRASRGRRGDGRDRRRST